MWTVSYTHLTLPTNMGEIRFRTLFQSKPEVAERLARLAEEEYRWRLSVYEQLSKMNCSVSNSLEEQKQEQTAEAKK